MGRDSERERERERERQREREIQRERERDSERERDRETERERPTLHGCPVYPDDVAEWWENLLPTMDVRMLSDSSVFS